MTVVADTSALIAHCGGPDDYNDEIIASAGVREFDPRAEFAGAHGASLGQLIFAGTVRLACVPLAHAENLADPTPSGTTGARLADCQGDFTLAQGLDPRSSLEQVFGDGDLMRLGRIEALEPNRQLISL